MTRYLVLLVAQIALLVLVPRVVFAWLGRRHPYYARLGKRFDRVLNVLLVVLVALVVLVPVVQFVLGR